MKYTDSIVDSFLKTKERTLKLTCQVCQKTIIKKRRYVQKNRKRSNYVTCSGSCARQLSATGKNFVVRECPVCSKEVRRTLSAVNRSKSKVVFCGLSCAAHQNNLNRPVGLRRSALEIWIESKLIERYPDLKIDFNRKNAIGSELDIYIPEFKLAFELNGFFHYFRIKKNNYGSIILKRTKANDARKVKACNEARINLHVINTSRVGHFSFSKSNRILSKITKVIDKVIQTKVA